MVVLYLVYINILLGLLYINVVGSYYSYKFERMLLGMHGVTKSRSVFQLIILLTVTNNFSYELINNWQSNFLFLILDSCIKIYIFVQVLLCDQTQPVF